MRNIKTMFAVPFAALFIGTLLQPAEAQTCTYTRTIRSYDSPTLIERTVESPVVIDDWTQPMSMDRRVVIDSPAIVEEPVVVRRPHHAFHLGLFPLGSFDLF